MAACCVANPNHESIYVRSGRWDFVVGKCEGVSSHSWYYLCKLRRAWERAESSRTKAAVSFLDVLPREGIPQEGGLQTSSVTVTWELVRNPDAGPHPNPIESETLGWEEPSLSVFHWAFLGVLYRMKFENHCCRIRPVRFRPTWEYQLEVEGSWTSCQICKACCKELWQPQWPPAVSEG